MDAFPMIFEVFPENAKVRFDYAGASGLRFRPLIFWLCASIFAFRFLHRFFEVFEPPRGPQIIRAAAEAGGRRPAAGGRRSCLIQLIHNVH